LLRLSGVQLWGRLLPVHRELLAKLVLRWIRKLLVVALVLVRRLRLVLWRLRIMLWRLRIVLWGLQHLWRIVVQFVVLRAVGMLRYRRLWSRVRLGLWTCVWAGLRSRRL